MGKYLIARGIFFEESIDDCKKYLSRLEQEIEQNESKGLPELTNKNGEKCIFSCSTQAWSSGVLLEAMKFLSKIKK